MGNFRVLCNVDINRTCNPGKYSECDSCATKCARKCWRSKKMEDIQLSDSQGNLVTEIVELPDSEIRPDTTPEQMLEFIKRAIMQNPIEIRLRVGHLVSVTKPVSAVELLGNNPELVGISKTFISE